MACDSKVVAKGRPAEYSAQIGKTLCGRLIEGESLREICADPGMPERDTIHHWLAHHADFRKSYELAQSMVDELLQEEIFEIADDAGGGWVEKVRARGRVVRVRERKHLARCRLRTEVRSWVLDQRLLKKSGLRSHTKRKASK